VLDERGESFTEQALDDARELGEFYECIGYAMLTVASLAADDISPVWQSSEAGRQQSDFPSSMAGLFVTRWAEAALALGDYTTARHWADQAAAATRGWHLSSALTTRARVMTRS
jgi:hypothetical protein